MRSVAYSSLGQQAICQLLFGTMFGSPGYTAVEIYEGHPISSDNGLISQKLLLKSEFYYPLHVAMDAAYSCLKYGVFIIT